MQSPQDNEQPVVKHPSPVTARLPLKSLNYWLPKVASCSSNIHELKNSPTHVCVSLACHPLLVEERAMELSAGPPCPVQPSNL